MTILKIAIWNANGLSQHKAEVQTFLIEQNIDIMLISETHFTKQNFFNITGYSVYDTKHPDGKAHGGTAVLIKRRLKHYELQKYAKDHIQATTVSLEEWSGKFLISAVYCPPKHAIKKQQFIDYFNQLGIKFLAGGDYNAKHVQWGSRLTSPKGKQLYEAINEKNLDYLSSGHPTYWPTDRKKIPDLIDFCVIRGIARTNAQVVDCYDLSSDHSPIIVTLSTQALKTEPPQRLTNKLTKWVLYRNIVDVNCHLDVPLRTPEDIDAAIENLSQIMEMAAKKATPENKNSEKNIRLSSNIQKLLAEKRTIRRLWQLHQSPLHKWKLNRAIKALREAIREEQNLGIQNYLSELTATETTDYSLWKAARNLKRPEVSNPPIRKPDGHWARSDLEKAIAFSNHLQKVFTPNEQNNDCVLPQLTRDESNPNPVKFKWKCVKKVIKNSINPKKAPGHDLITGKMIKELPDRCIKYITYIFNAIMRCGYFPQKWKISQIIMIPKPGKDETQVSSYRPISLLPIISKLFEKMLLQELIPILSEGRIIPDHQFGFREQHGTIEQVHRIVNTIKVSLEEKKYCSAVFLDIAQAFDKVWHEGLNYKIKTLLPKQFHAILENYLAQRMFQVKQNTATTDLTEIKAGVPQGSVLGPVLYLLFTADLPITEKIVTSTFADDTAILFSHKNPQTASRELQEHLHKIGDWLKTWRIRTNECKSTHVTFTLNKRTCPAVKLNNITIPQQTNVKYLGLHLDRRLTWKKHIETKRNQLKIKFSKMYWMIGRKSKLSLDCKVLLYKAILIPIWTYGIQLWGSTSASNIDIVQRTQAKILRSITNAPWYIRNSNIHRDLGIKTVKETIKSCSLKYQLKLESHPNELARELLRQPKYGRLRRTDPLDLIN